MGRGWGLGIEKLYSSFAMGLGLYFASSCPSQSAIVTPDSTAWLTNYDLRSHPPLPLPSDPNPSRSRPSLRGQRGRPCDRKTKTRASGIHWTYVISHHSTVGNYHISVVPLDLPSIFDYCILFYMSDVFNCKLPIIVNDILYHKCNNSCNPC